MPYPVLFQRLSSYNCSVATLVVLLVIGALVGALTAASGIYLLSVFPSISFKFQQIPFLMTVLGLMSVYAASVGTDGILHESSKHMLSLTSIILVILLGEAILMFATSMDPARVDRDLHQLWSSQYTVNRRRLSWYESYYGCCGFRNPGDMPSSNGCMGRFSEEQQVLGCMHYMREGVFLQNHQVLRLVLTAAVIQLVILGIGYWLYNIAFIADTEWLVEETADDIEAGGGNGGGQIIGAAEQIEATVPTPTADDTTAHEQAQDQMQKQTQADDAAAPGSQVESTAGRSAEAADFPDPTGTSGSPGSKKGSGSVSSQKSQEPWTPRTRNNKYK